MSKEKMRTLDKLNKQIVIDCPFCKEYRDWCPVCNCDKKITLEVEKCGDCKGEGAIENSDPDEASRRICHECEGRGLRFIVVTDTMNLWKYVEETEEDYNISQALNRLENMSNPEVLQVWNALGINGFSSQDVINGMPADLWAQYVYSEFENRRIQQREIIVTYRDCEYVGLVPLNMTVHSIHTKTGTTVPGMEDTTLFIASTTPPNDMRVMMKHMFPDHRIELPKTVENA